MPVERSAGAIVFHRREGDGLICYLLLRYASGHWDFPRGHVEEGEKPLETALREVEEETGLGNVEILPDFKEQLTWFYQREGKTVRKTVTYFLAESLDDHVTLSSEHEEYGWFPVEEALRTATYKGSKGLLRKANDRLKGRGGVQRRLV